MNLEALKAAIAQRKEKSPGLEELLSLILSASQEQPEGMLEGEGQEAKDEEEAGAEKDLAPMTQAMSGEEGDSHADAEQDKALIAKMLDEYGTSPMRAKMKAMKQQPKEESSL